MKSTITINLAPTKNDKEFNRESLGQLLQRCAKISKTFRYETGKQRQRTEMRYIVQWSILAVCKEILRTGSLPTPLEVRFARHWQQAASGFDFQPGRN
jgi:hypothetical protein